MREGRIVQLASPYAIYNSPADLAAAAFFSELNIITGTVRDMRIDTPFGLFLTPGLADGVVVDVAIRPQHLRMDFDRGGHGPAPSAEHGAWARAEVARARFMGSESLIELVTLEGGLNLKATVPGVFLPRPGTRLWLAFRRDRCLVFPRPPVRRVEDAAPPAGRDALGFEPGAKLA